MLENTHHLELLHNISGSNFALRPTRDIDLRFLLASAAHAAGIVRHSTECGLTSLRFRIDLTRYGFCKIH